jgi:hypothetical protein
MARVSLFDNTSGRFFTDIKTLCPRSWVLDGIGDATLLIPYNSPKYREEYVMPGNRVLVLDPKMPPWVGIVSDDIEFGQSAVAVKCFEAIKLLDQHVTFLIDTLTGSPGAQVAQLINLVNKNADSSFRLGSIYSGGESKDLKLGNSAMSHLRTIQTTSGQDWIVNPIVEDGRLLFELDWFEAAGIDAPSVLNEGQNMERNSSPLSQRGPIVNQIVGYSEASTDAERLVYIGTNEASAGKFGLRMEKRTYSGVKTLSALKASVDADVIASAWPRRTSQVNALDKGNLFYDLRLGNRLYTRFVRPGFEPGSVGIENWFRLWGLRTNDKGKCELTLRQVWNE